MRLALWRFRANQYPLRAKSQGGVMSGWRVLFTVVVSLIPGRRCQHHQPGNSRTGSPCVRRRRPQGRGAWRARVQVGADPGPQDAETVALIAGGFAAAASNFEDASSAWLAYITDGPAPI